MAGRDIVLKRSDARYAADAARLIYETGPEQWTAMFKPLPGLTLPTLERFCSQRWGTFGYGLTTAAFIEGEMVGLLLGFDRWQRKVHGKATLAGYQRHLPRELRDHMRAVSRDLGPAMTPIPDSAYYIAVLAVVNAHRQRGIGSLLLQDTFARARRRKYRACFLDVAVTNPQARRFYERHGMEVIHVRRDPQLESAHRVPGHWRMGKFF